MDKWSTMVAGKVTGPSVDVKEYLVCQYNNAISPKGFWKVDRFIFDYSLPALLFDVVLIVWTTRFIYFLSKPFQQSMITAQVLAGILLGPTILGQCGITSRLFNPGEKVFLEMIGNMGFMFHLFTIGLQMNIRVFRKAGHGAIFIGGSCFAIPYLLGMLTLVTLGSLTPINQDISDSLPYVVAVNSMSTFPVITSLLVDLNILNSEVGRLATYTSVVSDVCSLTLSLVMTTMVHNFHNYKLAWFWSFFCIFTFFIFIIYFIRPFIVWLTRDTMEGQQLEDHQFVVIVVLILLSALVSEVLGQHSAFGPLILGLSLPEGPPLGTSLVYKLNTLCTGIFLPVFFAISGLRMDFFSVVGGKGISLGVVELIIFMGYVGKFVGTFVPAIFCRVPFWDAISLSLIMCCKGVIEVATYNMWNDSKVLDDLSFTLVLFTMMIVTGFARPTVNYLYDPSKRYTTYGRRSILYSTNNVQLRILVCIHNEDNVPTIIKLLEASNPTRLNPISVYVLHLMELTCRAAAILVPHHNLKKNTTKATTSEHIVNACSIYEQQHQGTVVMQHFAAVAPYSSMHNDICTLALDKRTNIVILPFHYHWTFDRNETGSTARSIRKVNLNVVNKSPCSVAVLIDRGHMRGTQSILNSITDSYRIGLLFLGGPDDWEALAYGRRMAVHRNIDFTVVRFRCLEEQGNGKEKMVDNELIYDFKSSVGVQGKAKFVEKFVKDGLETTEVIRSMADRFDLVMVGRYHSPESPLMLGLSTEWSEFPELGVIGDILATSNFRFSVLVVQQQPQEEGLLAALPLMEATREPVVDQRMYLRYLDSAEDCTVLPAARYRNVGNFSAAAAAGGGGGRDDLSPTRRE
ncbi:cation/H(+) antiporter 14-like [Ziziphus jujuba]|uniref:Cation/H(+) antiporter 14-like n=1 Tax=Ziziphus jujuba TaxID=326968 RepID=A0A6P3ZIE9_ZIZJJ|nr:cation/H(+) antiporter 14-like [Ziziphus jujuba]